MIRTNMRPNLSGMVLHLSDADVWCLRPGQTAKLSVVAVFDHEEPDRVWLCGRWSGPDAQGTVLVEAQASVLPLAHPAATRADR